RAQRNGPRAVLGSQQPLTQKDVQTDSTLLLHSNPLQAKEGSRSGEMRPKPLVSKGSPGAPAPGRATAHVLTPASASASGVEREDRIRVRHETATPGERSDSEAEFGTASDSTIVLAILLVWAAGTGLVLGRASLAQCLFMIFRSRRRVVADESVLRRVKELAKALRIRRRVRVVESG